MVDVQQTKKDTTIFTKVNRAVAFRASIRAATLGLNLSEYLRHLLLVDLEAAQSQRPRENPSQSDVFDLERRRLKRTRNQAVQS